MRDVPWSPGKFQGLRAQPPVVVPRDTSNEPCKLHSLWVFKAVCWFGQKQAKSFQGTYFAVMCAKASKFAVCLGLVVTIAPDYLRSLRCLVRCGDFV